MPSYSPLAWRSSGAEPTHKGKTRVIMLARFDSPHLHHPSPGFRWKPGVFRA